MKIAIVHMAFMYSGGGERVAINQALHLRRRMHEVQVFTPVIRWDKCYPELLRLVKPQRIIPPFPLPFPFREASAMIASASIPVFLRPLRKFDILLCHSQPSMWIGFLVKKLFGIPYVGYLHQPTTFIHRRPEIAGNWATKGDFLVMDSLLGVFGRDMALHLDRLCHLSADGLLFNSKYTRSCFKELYGVKGDVCYPAIDAPAQSLDISETEQSKHDGSTLITANRHYPWKRIDLSIRLLKLLPSGTRLIATGEHTAHTRALMRVAIDLDLADRVIFTGFVSDRRLAELYTMSDLYVQTSIREPFGLSPLEAQSLGLPAVVWADGGVQETVLHGRTGFHATPYDLKDFAYRALMILGDQDLRDRMSREARIWASSFTWDKHIDIVEQALRKAV